MTELYIDGVAVVLPADFSTAVKCENPFFTKNGEYTYEITLSLLNLVNAEIYAHLNRINSVTEIKEKRKAVLIANNRVYCNGTEVITGWTDTTVSIQIASGNSELNFLISKDLLISSLDMGKDDISYTTIIHERDLNKVYPEVDYCLPTIITDNGPINGWRIAIEVKTSSIPVINSGYMRVKGVSIYHQPYLCAYINRLMQAMGYTVLINQLAESEWNLLYLPQNGHPTQYAQMFPGWSVNEFIAELENLFNLCFVVNNNRKQVSIYFRSEYYKNAKVCHIQRVVDTYDTEEGADFTDLSHSNVLIEPEDSDYYKPQHINRDIMLCATRKEFDAFSELAQFLMLPENQGYQKVKKYIFFIKDSYLYYIAVPDDSSFGWHTEETNMFGDLIRPDAQNDVTLKIIPADMTDYGLQPFVLDSGATPNYIPDSERSRVIVPKISGSEINENEESLGVYELMQSNNGVVTEKDKNRQKLYVCFYKGVAKMHLFVKRTNGKPFSPDHFIIDYPHSFNCEDYPFTGNLRLAYLDKMLFSKMYDIDVKHGIKLTSYDANTYDVRNIFEARNKRYVCKEIEYAINASGRNGTWTGTFYPIKINDIEADKRWILTDGKWRDGGTWLDNGRWLDE